MDVQQFFCKFCSNRAKTVKAHLHHVTAHRHLTKLIHCGLGHCLSAFRQESAFRSHVIRSHKIFMSKSRCKPFVSSSTAGKFVCPVGSCCKEVFSYKLLLSHLKVHLKTNDTVPCIVDSCTKKFSSINSLTGHVCKKHRQSIDQHQTGIDSNPIPSQVEAPFEDVFAPEEEVTAAERRDESLISIAQFYQKLEYKHMVPASTTQVIFKEIQSLLLNMERCFLNSLSPCLLEEGVSSETICSVLASVSKSNNLLDICHSLRSVYMRKKFYENNFSFVTPEKIPLSNGSFFYYVPIGKTLEASFQNKSWTFAMHVSSSTDTGMLKDFTDGKVFKSNKFFQDNPGAVPCILYQDGFQPVCPIGPASNLKHKLIGVYLAFGNLPAYIRFKKDNIQLVALCLNSDFNHSEVYGRIVEDVIQLQESGVLIENHGICKAGIAFIAGDNLGSHGLAGMVESFSKTKYFCRYCLVSKPRFLSVGGGETRKYPKRTIDSYNEDVDNVKVNPGMKHSRGVKFDSIFNTVDNFHVCSPGLPPCLGHDLCEGVVAYDLKLFIKYFVAQGWFTLSQLNNLIASFPYSTEEMKDKPCIIKKLKKERLAGGAWQLFTLMRLFPLIVHGYIDPSDNVWKLLLMLRDILLFSVAPEIHVSHLPSFQCIIDEYLSVGNCFQTTH